MESLSRKFFSPFPEILKAPLYRFGVYVTEKRGYLLLFFNHILIDGMGIKLFMQRLEEAFYGKELPMDTYYSYIERNEEFMQSEEFNELKKQLDEKYNQVNWSINFDSDKNEETDELGILRIPFAISRDMISAFEERTGNTREELLKVCILLTMARVNKKRDVLMCSTFHNRLDPVTKSALGITYKMIPTALELEKYKKMNEVFESVRVQAMNTIKYCQYNWTIQNESPYGFDYLCMSYETKDIIDGILKNSLGLQFIPFCTDGIRASVKTSLRVDDTDAGIAVTLNYSKAFYSEQRAKECSDALGSIIMELISAEDMKKLSVDKLI